MSLTCCAMLSCQIEWGNIIKDDLGLSIYGKPEFVNDGEGRYDDMTPSYLIEFCPFCGELLKGKCS